MKASIVIVTRNRCEHLSATLDSLRQVLVPVGLDCELMVIDNGSTDETARVVGLFEHDGISVRHVYEEKRGKSAGMNRAFIEARGDFILSADDDVRFPDDWIRGMLGPMVASNADAVAGGVVLASDLLRPWMTPMHRAWLAETCWLDRGRPQSYVGANMAIARHVLEKVSNYDPSLGPGALGYCDDVLFSSQLIRAGYRIADALDVCVVHHPEKDRLTRKAWLDAAWSRGLSQAYVGHHWEHWPCRGGMLKPVRTAAALGWWRMRHSQAPFGDGCDDAELRLVFEHATAVGHLREAKYARFYEKNSLRSRREFMHGGCHMR
ncbi:MAG: glycosyltransferase [Verrucomicrobia bacterium]|jgi:glycosyltransferase involved in cell wall biosynthesis|nr:glycosyltransferase [Verrucomicrobiota bacterium]